MAYVSVRATADASQYRTAMRQMTAEMKALSSAYVATQAKAQTFGKQSDILKNKQKELTDKIRLQKEIVKTTGNEHQRLTEKLQKQKTKHEELKAKINEVERAYNESVDATGKNSNASKQLKEELDKLKTSLKNNESSIASTEVALNKQVVAANKAETELTKYEQELKKLNQELADHKLDSFAKACETTGNKLESFGRKMSVVSAGAAAFIVGSSKAAIEFESAFTGVTKTCDEVYDKNGKLAYSYEDLRQEILNMSQELPQSTTEISAVAEAAGQLGIKTEDISGFSKVMLGMGEATNISSDVAATSLARFANITGLASDEAETAEVKYGRLASTIVALGNNSATSEAEIVEMGMRIAGAGKQINMTDAEIMALAASLSSVGIEAEAGGTAISTVMSNIDKAVSTNGKTLSTWAAVAGMSSADFKAAWSNDVMGTLQLVIGGLGDAKAGGENLNILLEELGISGIRQTDMMKRLSGASDILNNSVDIANSAWQENSALADEVAKRHETLESQLGMLRNKAQILGITFGEILMPHLQNGVDVLSGLCDWFGNLSQETQGTILKTSLLVAAMAPLLIVTGKVAKGVSDGVKAYKEVRGIIQKVIERKTAKIAVDTAETAATKAGTTATAAKTLSTMKNTVVTTANTVATKAAAAGQRLLNSALLANPIVRVIAIVALLVTGFIALYKNSETVRAAVQKLWGEIKTNLIGAFNTLKPHVIAIKDALMELWNTIKAVILPVFNEFKAAVKQIYNENKPVITAIVSSFKTAFNTIKTVIKTVFDNIVVVIRTALGVVKNVINLVTAAIKGDWQGVWNSVKSIASTIWNGIKSYLSNILNGIASIFGIKLSGIQSKVTSIFNGVKNSISEKMEAVSTKVKTVIDRIKGFFNFKVSMPHIPLPHFSISPAGWKVGDLLKGSIPKLSISWYRYGGIMTRPTAFAMAGNTIMAGGEAGAEAILPLDTFYKKLNTMLNTKLEALEQAVNVNIESHTYIDGEEVASRTETKVLDRMAINMKKRR